MTPIHSLCVDEPGYPSKCRERLGIEAPGQLNTMGNLGLMNLYKTGLFCSVRCPGNAILGTYDKAAKWRDEGRCIISGFHSPVEKECLRILLRGLQPIVICPARTLPLRVPQEWQQPLLDGRLLLLSGFAPTEKRVTAELATRRNEFAAALADEVFFASIAPGGKAEHLCHRLAKWHVPFSSLNTLRQADNR